MLPAKTQFGIAFNTQNERRYNFSTSPAIHKFVFLQRDEHLYVKQQQTIFNFETDTFNFTFLMCNKNIN